MSFVLRLEEFLPVEIARTINSDYLFEKTKFDAVVSDLDDLAEFVLSPTVKGWLEAKRLREFERFENSAEQLFMAMEEIRERRVD